MFRPFVTASAVLISCGLAVAQTDDPTLTKKQNQTVFVRDSATVTEKLALAQRMERLKEWDRSADVYQEVVMKLSDRVVVAKTDDAGLATLYISAGAMVQNQLATWPAEGIAVYRRRFEDTARDLFNTAPDDRATWRRVMGLYFPTDAAKEAAIRLLNDSIERGEFTGAVTTGTRLLKQHPALIAERPMVLFETALAAHLSGDSATANEFLRELKTKFAGATGTLGGADANLASTLETTIKTQPPLSLAYAGDDWPNPFGTPDASAVPTTITAGGAKLFSLELASMSSRNRSLKPYQDRTSADRRLGAMTGIQPTIDHGALFFQDNTHLYAVDLSSGLPLPGWAATYPGEKRGAYTIEGFPSAPGDLFGVNVSGDRVVALMGQPVNSLDQTFVQSSKPQLVCLNREDGRRNWGVTMAAVKVPDEFAKLHDANFYGTPVVANDSVYALLHTGRGTQFEEVYVVAFNLADGAFKWASYVSSTSAGAAINGFIENSEMPIGTVAQLTFADDRLYVLTNEGAVACLQADSGVTQWLNVYPSSTDAMRAGPAVRNAPVVRPFTINPPIVAAGRVFVLPTDGKYISVYDAISGEVIAQLPRKLDAKYSETVDLLLAAVGDKVVLGSRNFVFVAPWKSFDANKSLLDNGGMFRNFSSGDASGDAIRGRPFVSQKYVLIPTTEKLYRMTLDQFKFESVYPADGKWDEDEAPGNVIATPDNLIIAGSSRVVAYADLAAATAKLDARIGENPDDVDAYLHYGELYFASGRSGEAIARLDQAIQHLGGVDGLRSGPLRDRLFEIIDNATAKLQRAAVSPPDVMRVLFDRAKFVAGSPQQQVRYRIAQAQYLRKIGDVPAELALHQQILADDTLRNTPAVDKGGGMTAGGLAERSIGELIQKNGVEIYAAFEAAAQERLAKEKRAEAIDPDAVLAIADEYPAASGATEMLALAGARFEATHQPRRATQTLRRLLKTSIAGGPRVAALEALARNYLAVPNQLDIGLVRLKQAGAMIPDAKLSQPLVLADGRTIADQTLGKAAELLEAYRQESFKSGLPQLQIPPSGSGGAAPRRQPFEAAHELGVASAIIEQQQNVARTDRIVVLSREGFQISVYDNMSDRPLWADVEFGEAPIGCAYGGDVLVVVGATRAMAISPEGKPLWQTSLSGLPIEKIRASAEPAPTNDNDNDNSLLGTRRQRVRATRLGRIPRGLNGNVSIVVPDDTIEEVPQDERVSNFLLLSDRVLLGTTSGRAMSLDLVRGAVTWQMHLVEQPIRHFVANDDFLAISYIQGSASDVYIFDAITGGVVWHDSYDSNNGVQQSALTNLAMSPDGVLITMQPSRLLGRDLYDLSTPQWFGSASAPNVIDFPFISSGGENQLVITGKYVLALARESTTQAVHVRPFDLRSLNPLTVHTESPSRDTPIKFATRVAQDDNGSELGIVASGPLFYVVGSRSLAAYNIEHPENYWNPASTGAVDHGVTRRLELAQEYVVQISQIASPAANATRVPAIELSLWSRATTPKGAESGRIEYRLPLNDPTGFLAGQWQVANDSFFFVTGDQKLKVLRAKK